MFEFKVEMKAIIRNSKGKILAVQRCGEQDVEGGIWDIPGGRLFGGEDPVDWLKRRIREETGMKVKIKRPFNVWSFMPNNLLQVVVITMVADYVESQIRLSEENSDYKWVTPLGFLRLNAHQVLKDEIKKYIASLEQSK